MRIRVSIFICVRICIRTDRSMDQLDTSTFTFGHMEAPQCVYMLFRFLSDLHTHICQNQSQVFSKTFQGLPKIFKDQNLPIAYVNI